MRPSEIIAAALSSGELTSQDVAPEAPETETETGNNSLPSVPSLPDAVLPPTPPETDATLPDLAKESEDVDGEDGEGDGSDSDKESDYEPDEGAEKNDVEEEVGGFLLYLQTLLYPIVVTHTDTMYIMLSQEFANEEEDFEGPELLPTPVGGTAGAVGVMGLRAVLVREHDMRHAFFPSAAVPASMADLLGRLE